MLRVRRRYSIARALETEATLLALNRRQRRTRREAPAPGTETAGVSPALTCGAYEFGPKRLEPAPQLSPNRLVFEVSATRADWCLERSPNLMSREAVAKGPLPTRGLPRT